MRFILKVLQIVYLLGSPIVCFICAVWTLEHESFEGVVRAFIVIIYFIYFSFTWISVLIDITINKFDKENK